MGFLCTRKRLSDPWALVRGGCWEVLVDLLGFDKPSTFRILLEQGLLGKARSQCGNAHES